MPSRDCIPRHTVAGKSPASRRGNACFLLPTRKVVTATAVEPCGRVRRRLGDPGGRLRQSGSGPRCGRRRPRPGAGPAPLRCLSAAADGALRRQGPLPRSPRPFVGERRDERLRAAQSPSTTLRRRPAEQRLSAGTCLDTYPWAGVCLARNSLTRVLAAVSAAPVFHSGTNSQFGTSFESSSEIG